MTRHGTYSHYVTAKCRCAHCAQAQYRYSKHRTMRRRQGPLLTPATGTRRRLEALRAIGYPTTHLAHLLGRARSTLITPQQTHVLTSYHDQVKTLFDTLSMTPGPSNSARIRAIAAGCHPPLAWDENTIDDPDATPQGTRKDAT